MRIGTSYKQHRGLAEDWDAIVIGSGIGGLAAAATLAKFAGKRVLVLERHYTAGGFTHVFRRPGYEWDVGVHYIGEVMRPDSGLRRVFDYVTDGALEWADMGDVYDRIIIEGREYDFVKGRERWRAQMHSYFPDERDAIDQYLELVRDTTRKSQLFFAEKAVPKPISALLGGLMRRPLLKQARRTTREVLEELTDNQELIGVLTGQYGDYGLPPSESSFFMHSIVVRHYLSGAAYPIGGSSRIAATIEPVIEAAGGEIITCAEVEQIVMKEGRAVAVRIENGREFRAPLIISDAGVVNTYERLLPNDVAEQHGLIGRAESIQPSVAHMSIYVGLDKTDEELGLTKTNLWIYPSPHHEQNIERFLEDPEAPLPVAYLSFPSAKDPDFQRRCPGRATVEVITLAPYEWFQKWEGTKWKKRGADYDAFKDRFKERLLAELYKQRPATRGHVDVCEISTPLSTKNFANHPHGEIYGLTHTPDRFEQRWLQPRTPIKGLYLTGADICSAGVGGALMGGLLCSSAALNRNLVASVLGKKSRRTLGHGEEPLPATR